MNFDGTCKDGCNTPYIDDDQNIYCLDLPELEGLFDDHISYSPVKSIIFY
jgi:hypothetical protein